ncbi:MAG: hypothetical protein EB127_21025, partial [Alphaproteobacteria bacterium]|nr:hypothetical protein [Alphaproteobacteria bacterium]
IHPPATLPPLISLPPSKPRPNLPHFPPSLPLMPPYLPVSNSQHIETTTSGTLSIGVILAISLTLILIAVILVYYLCYRPSKRLQVFDTKFDSISKLSNLAEDKNTPTNNNRHTSNTQYVEPNANKPSRIRSRPIIYDNMHTHTSRPMTSDRIQYHPSMSSIVEHKPQYVTPIPGHVRQERTSRPVITDEVRARLRKSAREHYARSKELEQTSKL